jgi:hypothetical protein
LSRKHCLVASQTLPVIISAPRGEAARSRTAGGGESLRARQIDITDAKAAALNLTLEFVGGWEICAIEVRNATIEVARDEILLDDALASLWAGLRRRTYRWRCRIAALAKLMHALGALVALHAHALSFSLSFALTLSLSLAFSLSLVCVDKDEARQEQDEENNKTGGLHGGLHERDGFANGKQEATTNFKFKTKIMRRFATAIHMEKRCLK